MRTRPSFLNKLHLIHRNFIDLLRDRAANVAVVFSIAVPVLLIVGGGAIDYGRSLTSRASLQAMADGAALAGVQSLRVSNGNAPAVTQAVSAYVAAQAGANASNIAISTNLLTNNTVVAVQLTQTVPTLVANAVGFGPMTVIARAQASNSGNPLPVCAIGLDPTQSGTISVNIAKIRASGCQILSESTAANSVSITNGATVNAGRLCSSGGATSDGSSSFSPAAQTNCAALSDPLAALAAPNVGSCAYNNLSVSSGTQSLLPGVYCGGLTINGDANVTLMAGTYIMTGGPLTISDGANVQGTDVTVYLASNDATLNIANNTTLSLAAPAVGPMAGILIFENRAATLYRNHYLESGNAANMLGTIYIPRGILNIGLQGATAGVAAIGASSAWTIIVARKLAMTDNQQIVLNTNYGATPVPPPAGLGPTTIYGSRPALTQ